MIRNLITLFIVTPLAACSTLEYWEENSAERQELRQFHRQETKQALAELTAAHGEQRAALRKKHAAEAALSAADIVKDVKAAREELKAAREELKDALTD